MLRHQSILQFRLLARGGIDRNDNRYQWWDEFILDDIISANVTMEVLSHYTKGNNGFLEVEFYTGQSEYLAGEFDFDVLRITDMVCISSAVVLAFTVEQLCYVCVCVCVCVCVHVCVWVVGWMVEGVCVWVWLCVCGYGYIIILACSYTKYSDIVMGVVFFRSK